MNTPVAEGGKQGFHLDSFSLWLLDDEIDWTVGEVEDAIADGRLNGIAEEVVGGGNWVFEVNSFFPLHRPGGKDNRAVVAAETVNAGFVRIDALDQSFGLGVADEARHRRHGGV